MNNWVFGIHMSLQLHTPLVEEVGGLRDGWKSNGWEGMRCVG